MGPVSEFTNLVEEQHGGQQRGRTVWASREYGMDKKEEIQSSLQ